MKLENDFSNKAIDAFIKISAIAILVFWYFSILKPFMLLVVWGGIIATALYPIVTWGHNKCGIAKGKVSAGLAFIGVVQRRRCWLFYLVRQVEWQCQVLLVYLSVQ